MMLTIVESAPLGLLEEVLDGLLVAVPAAAGVDERVTPWIHTREELHSANGRGRGDIPLEHNFS
jgi:hypothetical protein